MESNREDKKSQVRTKGGVFPSKLTEYGEDAEEDTCSPRYTRQHHSSLVLHQLAVPHREHHQEEPLYASWEGSGEGTLLTKLDEDSENIA